MLVEFTVKNYRSFRDVAVLSMEATGLSTLKSVLIHTEDCAYCPALLFMERTAAARAM